MRTLLIKKEDFGKEVLEVINREVGKGSWPVHGAQWKNWLGILLKKIRHNQSVSLERYPHLLELIVWLSKTVVR